MDIKDLLASFAEIDEMEAPDGMNIAETEEMISNSELQYSYNVSVIIQSVKLIHFFFSRSRCGMVAHQRRKQTKLQPAHQKIRRRVAAKTADIRTCI